MSRRIFTTIFICLVAVCLVMGFHGIAAKAAEEPARSGKAYEEERTCIGGMCYYTGRQYTSQYDLMRGEIFPNVTVSYAMPDWMGAMTGTVSSSSRGSAIGGLFTGPMFQFPTSPLSYMMGTYGAPQYSTSESYNPFFGSQSMTSMYQGLGFGGSGFMLGPFRSLWSGGYGGGYGYPGGGGLGYTGASSFGGFGGYYSGFGGYGVGGYPTRIY
ncbi:MAG: hypothetical protein ACMUIL_11035 [bacterium]